MSSPGEESLKTCIRGLPATADPRAVGDELRKIGFFPLNVRRLEPRQDRPGCIFFVQVENTRKTVHTVYELKHLLDVPVTVEAWRSNKGPTQCGKCQGFWHKAEVCHREDKCLRCAGPHRLRQCIRSRDHPICANCGGPHTAVHTSCPVYRREERKMAPTIPRNSGYALNTPNAVIERSAPSSLMAAANEKYVYEERPKRNKRRGGKKRGKGYLSETDSTVSSEPQQLSFQQTSEAITTKEKVESNSGLKTNAAANRAINTDDSGLAELQVQQKQTAISIPKNNEKNAKASRTNAPNPDIVRVVVVPQEPKKSVAQETPKTRAAKEKTVADALCSGGQKIPQETKKPVAQDTSETRAIMEKPDAKVQIPQETQNQQLIQHQPPQSTPTLAKETKDNILVMSMNPEEFRTKVIGECLTILQNVLSAIQEGQSPIPVIIRGLNDLKMYHGLGKSHASESGIS